MAIITVRLDTSPHFKARLAKPVGEKESQMEAKRVRENPHSHCYESYENTKPYNHSINAVSSRVQQPCYIQKRASTTLNYFLLFCSHISSTHFAF